MDKKGLKMTVNLEFYDLSSYDKIAVPWTVLMDNLFVQLFTYK